MSEVKAGGKGWLFLTGGTNQVLRLYTDPDFFTDDMARSWLSLLRRRHARLAAQHVAYHHLIVPDKLSVFARHFGADLSNFAGRPVAKVLTRAHEYRLGGCIIDCAGALDRTDEPFPTFYKTDSHWTVRGAHIAYMLACRAMGVPESAIVGFEDRPFSVWPETFDLGAKLPEPVTESKIFTPMAVSVTRVFANRIVELREEAERCGADSPMHHGVHVVFRNERADCVAGKLVIFGDSFADYRPSTLTAFFAETFAETHFIWSTDLDHGYIERIRPDFVLSEIAERFMTVLPTDDYDNEAFAEARVLAYLAKTAAVRPGAVGVSAGHTPPRPKAGPRTGPG